jgi:hypothetical protein
MGGERQTQRGAQQAGGEPLTATRVHAVHSICAHLALVVA